MNCLKVVPFSICFSMIDVCDVVYMQKDWKNSKSAKIELEYVKKNKKQIFYEDERI
ncbi:DUF4406 domain-containing protein [Treponema pectinovorum]|uniref:DUF4406 domain-containing protein n=1 Tax=Treponema pectinovorum TaxID=164 RepID=UPI0011C8D6B3|nr:DUF4406 domain-containing protein [Treponema pectinovorum]